MCLVANAYTVFWTHDRYNTLRRLGWAGRRLETLFGGPHTSEPSFTRAGVRAGDRVHPITVRAGVLYVLGSARVRRIITLDDYVRQHADLFSFPLNEPPAEAHNRFIPSSHCWMANAFYRYRATNPAVAALAPTCTDEVVECEESTPLRFALAIPPDLLARLRYRSQHRERDLSQHLHDGRLVRSIAIQGIYRLGESSAHELEALVLGIDMPSKA